MQRTYLLLAGALATTSDGLYHQLGQSADSQQMAERRATPIVKTYGVEKFINADSEWGLDLELNMDLSAGYQAVLFWLLANNENLVALNPALFAELAAHGWLTLRTPFAHFSLNADVTPFKFTPLDYQASWSLDSKGRYCHSLGYDQDVMDFELRVEASFDECFWGVLGKFSGDDSSDCTWRRYYPQLPIYKVSRKEEWDNTQDYWQWTCNYERSIPADFSEPSNSGADDQTDEAGWDIVEPSNIVQ